MDTGHGGGAGGEVKCPKSVHGLNFPHVNPSCFEKRASILTKYSGAKGNLDFF